MAKFLKKFGTTTDYQIAESIGLILPNVSWVIENNKVMFNPSEARLVCKYNVKDVSSETKLCDDDTVFTAMEIDGVNQPSVTTGYTFSTTGEHTAKFTLTDPTSIPYGSFVSCTDLTTVDIPDSVTSIGNSAFTHCGELTAIDISSGITSIGDYAFANCVSLTNIVVVPSGVTSIGDYAFYNCGGITNIIIPNTVSEIGDGAFMACTELEEATVNANVTHISDNMFNGCTTMSAVTMPNSVETIGVDAFKDCLALTGVSIPNGATSIGDGAFNGCTSMTTINIPDSVTEVGNNAFAGCTSLPVVNNVRYADTYIVGTSTTAATSYTVSYGTRFIGDGTFSGCSNATEITIPSTVISIGENAFKDCTSLSSITIPNSVTNIDDYAFANCDNITSFTIPDSVVAIGVNAFQGCNNLQTVTIGTGLTYINAYEFEGCTSLTSVTIGNNVTLIDDSAFKNCASLSSITIPNAVETIGEDAFEGCAALTSVTIPNSVNAIESGAFSGCTSMTMITVTSTTPPTLEENAFDDTNNSRIDVPCSSLSVYRAENGWRTYANRIWSQPAVTSVTLDKNVMEVFTGVSYTLTATVSPNDACTNDVVWSTSDSSIVSIAQNGTFTSVGLGEAIISVTTVDGGLTATCVVTVVKRQGEVTVVPTVADGLIYNNTAQSLLATAGSGTGAMMYKLDDGSWGSSIPTATNATSYTIYYKAAESADYYESPSGSVNCSIAKADPAYTAPSAKSLTYNGNSQALLNAGSTSHGTIQYSPNNSSWSTTIPSQTNADTYTSYWRLIGDSNHNDKTSTSISTTIAKAAGSVSTKPTARSLTYNATAQDLVNAGSGTGTIMYKLGSSSYSSTLPSATNATSYTVYYYAAESANYKQSAEGSVACTIAKVTPTVTAPTPKVLTFNDANQVLANAGSTNYGTIQYCLNSSGGTYSTTVPSASAANVTYKVWYKVVGNSNVNDVAPQSIDCSIAEKRVTTPTITLSPSSYTYNGSQCKPTPTVKDGSTVIPSSEYTTTYSNNTNAGTATVIISDNTAGNYYISGTTTFTINKAGGSVTTAPVNTNYTYNGTARAVASAGSGTGTMYYRLGTSGSFSTTMPTMTNAGSSTLYYYAAASTNYEQSSTGSITVSVQKANISPTVSISNWTYGGTASNPSVAGNSGSGTVTYYYKSTSSSSWSTTKPSAAGSYNIRADIAATTNYNSGTCTNSFTINKATPSYTAPSAKSLTYTGSGQALLNAGSTSHGTIQYSPNNSSWSTTIPSQTNAGTYTSYWKVVNDSNHSGTCSGSVSTTIAKANQSAPTATGATVSYGSTATATASGGGGQGSIEWSNGNTQTSVGSKTTNARWSGNGNYNASPWSNSVTLTVNDPYAGHAYVDLGLPSGTKWATMNVGATSETDYGNFYQYGRGSSQYSATSGQTDYSGTEDPLATSADTAAQVWGGSWHMPTEEQILELCNECTWTWGTNGGINGYTVSNNGKSIFLPAAGFMFFGSYNEAGVTGLYLSSNYYDNSNVVGLKFWNRKYNSGGNSIKSGFSVRGVVG